jgi:hypothetical protein
MTDHHVLEHNSAFSISIFDIMTKAHLKKVYKDLDWQMVRDATEIFEYKQEQEKRRNKNAFETEVQVIVERMCYNKDKYFNQIKIQIHPETWMSLETKVMIGRKMPLTMKSKYCLMSTEF